MKAAGYIRVSSEEQVTNFSLSNQKDYILKTAETMGYEVDRIFEEAGKSAKNLNRPALTELLEYCRKHQKEISALFIYKTDRLSRSTLDYLSVKAILARYDIKIISCTEPSEESPAGRLLETMMSAVAQFDNDTKSQRTLDGMRKRFEEGWCHGKPPIGYKTVIRNDVSIVVKDSNFDQIQKAWIEMSKGVYSLVEIAEQLNSWGVTTEHHKNKHKMTKQQCSRIFRNRFYLGYNVSERWGELKGKHEPMVDETTFYRVQAILDGKKPSILKYQRNNPDFPLRHFYKCSICGRPLTGAWCRGRNKRYPYYFCQSKHGGMYKRKLVHQRFIRMLAGVKPKPEFMELFGEVVKEKYGQQVEMMKQRESRIETQINNLLTKKKVLIEKNLKGIYSDELFQEEIERIEAEIIVCKTQQAEDKMDELNIEILVQFMKNMINNIDRAWSEGDLKQRRLIAGSIFPDGLVYEKHNYQTMKFAPPFNLIFNFNPASVTFGVVDRT